MTTVATFIKDVTAEGLMLWSDNGHATEESVLEVIQVAYGLQSYVGSTIAAVMEEYQSVMAEDFDTSSLSAADRCDLQKSLESLDESIKAIHLAFQREVSA